MHKWTSLGRPNNDVFTEVELSGNKSKMSPTWWCQIFIIVDLILSNVDCCINVFYFAYLMNIFSLFWKYHYNAKQLRIKVENTCSDKFWNRVNLTLRMPEPLGSTGHKQQLPFPVKDKMFFVTKLLSAKAT